MLALESCVPAVEAPHCLGFYPMPGEYGGQLVTSLQLHVLVLAMENAAAAEETLMRGSRWFGKVSWTRRTRRSATHPRRICHLRGLRGTA